MRGMAGAADSESQRCASGLPGRLIRSGGPARAAASRNAALWQGQIGTLRFAIAFQAGGTACLAILSSPLPQTDWRPTPTHWAAASQGRNSVKSPSYSAVPTKPPME
jgi:hypothetical protein